MRVADIVQNELKPLITGWKHSEIRAQDRAISIFEKDDTLVAFGGIGVNAARIAADAAYNYANRSVSLMISAGLAGALVPELRVGHVLVPETIISESEDTNIETASGIGVLLTAGAVAGRKIIRLCGQRPLPCKTTCACR